MKESFDVRIEHCQNHIGKTMLEYAIKKSSNLIVSIDETSTKRILSISKKIAPYAVAIKIHLDIIEDISKEFLQDLKGFLKDNQCLLFEDRKFADIGHIVYLQYQHAFLGAMQYADMFTVHAVAGHGPFEAIAQVVRDTGKSIGILGVVQMSTLNHLMTEEYMHHALDVLEEYPDLVFGAITQHELTMDPGFIHVTPGISLDKKSDSMGQSYRTPEDAIATARCDFVVVGRGICHNASKNLAQEYQERSWNAYLSLCKDS